MSRRTPFGTLLLILLLPTPALCTTCAAEGCEMETAADDCPMETAPDDCCGEMAAMGHDMPMGHDCASRSGADQPMAATAGDCCAAAAGREAKAPASAPVSHGYAPLAQSAHRLAPDLAASAADVSRWMPPSAAPRALFTLHSSLLI